MPDNLVRLDNPSVSIRGTSERVPACYPITARLNGRGEAVWSYSGESSSIYDEEAKHLEDEATGEQLFMDEGGEDVPLSGIGLVLEDGRIVPLKGEG